MENIILAPVDSTTVMQAKEIIIEGLTQYFGTYDGSFNPDLDNILQTYQKEGSLFLIALYNKKVVGTGAIIPENPTTARIVRMYVSTTMRGKHIGHQMITALEDFARHYPYKHMVIETTNTWYGAQNFYIANNYTSLGEKDGDIHFIKHLV